MGFEYVFELSQGAVQAGLDRPLAPAERVSDLGNRHAGVEPEDDRLPRLKWQLQ